MASNNVPTRMQRVQLLQASAQELKQEGADPGRVLTRMYNSLNTRFTALEAENARLREANSDLARELAALKNQLHKV